MPWSLPDLPTAQHKAGLAGLFVYISKMPEFIHEWADSQLFPTVQSVSALELSVRFTQASLTTLMDSVYAGEEHLVEVPKQKWQRADMPDERKKQDGRGEMASSEKSEGISVYEVVRPKAELIAYWRGGDGEDSVGRLVARGCARGSCARAVTRRRYTNLRLKRESPTEKSGDLNELWSGLVAAARESPGGGQGLCRPPCSSARKRKSAERVDFKGEVHHNLLLHFLGRSCLRFIVPREVQRKSRKWVTSDCGFVMAVPEVAHLTDFREASLMNIGAGYRDPMTIVPTAHLNPGSTPWSKAAWTFCTRLRLIV